MNSTEFARYLRREESKAEAMFWNEVRNRKFMGLKFKRQVPVNKYFADFLCEGKKIIIELDDISHDQKQEQDAERTKVLELYGYTVIRYLNEEIYEDLDGVMEDLQRKLS